jgi:glycosyltransferase involved in cell wall biosynthesis
MNIENFLAHNGELNAKESFSLGVFPLVTVGVCVKNSESSIYDCLESIIRSNYDKLKLEIVLVDGNSTDRTLIIAKQLLEKSGISFRILNDNGKGLGYARQMVVDHSRGEYICWVDADSALTSNFILNQVSFLEGETNIGAVIPLILFTNNNTISKLQGYSLLLPSLKAAVKKKTPHLAMNGSITPKKVLISLGGFNLSIRGAGEDLEIFERMTKSGYRLETNVKAQIYHYTENCWRDVFRQASWWGKGWPMPKSGSQIVKNGLKQQFLYIKIMYGVIKHFQDLTGILIPFYGIVWNSWFILSALSAV